MCTLFFFYPSFSCTAVLKIWTRKPGYPSSSLSGKSSHLTTAGSSRIENPDSSTLEELAARLDRVHLFKSLQELLEEFGKVLIR